MKAKIISFLTSDTSSSLSNFLRMLDNSYSHNVLKSACLSTWHCSWLLTVYLFSWNLKMICKLPYKYKSLVLISNFIQLEIFFTIRNVCALTLITGPRLNEAKSENNSLLGHLFFHRLWYIRCFILPSLDIIYGFRLDASESKIWYTHLILPFHTIVEWYQLFPIDTVNDLLKSFHLQRLIKEVTHKNEQQQSRFYWNREHSYRWFASLKWFRKVHIHHTFLINDDKYNFTCSLFWTTRK